jgi:hypothetical protein
MVNTETPRSDGAKGGSPGGRRRIPPLVWIIVAILVAWFAIAMWQRQGVHRTPSGGTMTSEAEGQSYMPPAPANGSAPATPGGAVNGAYQPPASDASQANPTAQPAPQR